MLNRLLLFLWLAVVFRAAAAEVIPPAPSKYFNDYAGTVPASAADALNKRLEAFEKETSSQVLVAVFPKMQSDSSIEDYTVRVAESWKAGQKGKDNGAILFVFVQDRKVYLQVGYGLEGAIPDALAKRIIDSEVTPRFRSGDFQGGLEAGVSGILAAARGEYTGTGRTVAQSRGQKGGFVILFMFLVVLMIAARIGIRRPRVNGPFRRGRYGRGLDGWYIGSGGFGGGGFGGGGGGGGGFSGGGGGFGGGGAGGSW